MNISLFITCFNDTLFPETGKATVKILERLGHAVDFPPEQTCCGQIHYNTGYHEDAVPLVRGFIDIFSGADAVVAPSASCVAMVHEFYPEVAKRTGAGMYLLARTFRSRKRYERAQKMARSGQGLFARNGMIIKLPGMLSKWTDSRDLKTLPDQTFREWWKERS